MDVPTPQEIQEFIPPPQRPQVRRPRIHSSPPPLRLTMLDLNRELRNSKKSLSRFFPPRPPPSPPPTLKPTASRNFIAVPTYWCPDGLLLERFRYLSREQPLKRMYSRHVSIRVSSNNQELHLQQLDMRISGGPMDYFLTYPLKPPHLMQYSPPLNNGNRSAYEVVTYAWVTGPIKCTRNSLERPAASQPTFASLTGVCATQIQEVQGILSLLDERNVSGYVGCVKCGNIKEIRYILPRRFTTLESYILKIKDKIDDNGDELLSKGTDLYCECPGGKYPFLPIISENFSKINWAFLLLFNSLGYCTLEQLQYFCLERKLPALGTKNNVLYYVALHLLKQLNEEKECLKDDTTRAPMSCWLLMDDPNLPCGIVRILGNHKFPWQAGESTTEIYNLRDIISRGIKFVTGYMECRFCRQRYMRSYMVEERGQGVLDHAMKNKGQIGEKLLFLKMGFGEPDIRCQNCDGKVNNLYPSISEDPKEINWLFLLLGFGPFGFGYCTIAQLQYYCRERKLAATGSKHDLIYRVCHDLCKQLRPMDDCDQ